MMSFTQLSVPGWCMQDYSQPPQRPRARSWCVADSLCHTTDCTDLLPGAGDLPALVLFGKWSSSLRAKLWPSGLQGEYSSPQFGLGISAMAYSLSCASLQGGSPASEVLSTERFWGVPKGWWRCPGDQALLQTSLDGGESSSVWQK